MAFLSAQKAVRCNSVTMLRGGHTDGGVPRAGFRWIHGYRFTLRPNCALSWRRTKWLVLFFACCLGLVGCYFAALGAWLVLPFAGLELVVLAGGFYLSALAGHRREVIEINGSDLRVLRGGRRLEEVARLSRYWTQVSLLRDPRGWYPSRLLLRCHGGRYEVGVKLVEAEREELGVALQGRLGFRQSGTAQAVAEAVSPGLESPLPTGHGVRALTGFSLPRERERATRCARGALPKK